MCDKVAGKSSRGAGRRLLAILVGMLVPPVVAWGLPRVGLGQTGNNAQAADVLRSTPFDRVTLIDGTVLLVDPISPRPLPSIEPKDKKKEYKPEKQGNIFLPGERAKLGLPAENEEEKPGMVEVNLHLLQGEQRDFRVKRGQIKRVEYFEDLLLAEGDRLVTGHDFAKAFECYLRVKARQPGWAGLDDHVDRLLFEEGSKALLDGDGERGLRLLREIFARKPNYPGLADKLAKSYGSRIDRAFGLGLYAKGRKILHELEPLAPNHPIVREARERFVSRARELADEAARRLGAERLDLLVDALRVWPAADGVGASYAEAFRAEPTLDVGVGDLPRPIGPWVRSPADERISRLLYLPILARDDDEATRGNLPGQLASGLTSSDLGRKLVVSIRKGVGWADGSRPVSAIDVARSFTDRAEPSSPLYNARWADLLDRVETPDEAHVELRLTRPFLKPGSWLTSPVGPAHAGWDGRVATADRGRLLVGDGPFRWTGSDGDRMTLRALNNSKIRRVREVRLSRPQAAVGALVRGEISLLEHVPPNRVAELAANGEIKIGRYARPSVHRIAVDGRNPVLRNRALRRGLSYAIDRKTLLEEALLKRPSDSSNAASDGPFAKGSYADAPGVEPLGYDPLLAKMLVAAARKELGGEPIKLTLEYPALPEPQAVVPKLVEAFKAIGLDLKAVERPESELEEGLRSGRRFDLAYRASRSEEPVLEAGNLLCPGYDASPSADALSTLASPRILQLLLQLERAPEWPTAKGILIQIDRESRDELPVLPLWQLEDHYAWRTRLKGPAEVAETLYQGIDTWEIEPWYAKDPW